MAIEKIVNVVLTDVQHEMLKKVATHEKRSMRAMASVLLNRAVREAEIEINKQNG